MFGVSPNFPPGGWPMPSLLWFFRIFLGKCLEWMTSVFNFVKSSPALLILVIAFPVISFGFGLFRRLKNS